jgi:aryl-alcohol dehydrogenase-like predicted oxidoreductase
MGCWAWGDRIVWNYGLGYGEADLQQAFDVSLAEGVTFFDTAEIYGFGKSEKLLGKFMANSNNEVVVASKFFPYPWRFSALLLKGALRRSLKRLGQPAIQLYQMHWPYAPVRIESWMNSMADAVEAGLIKQIGVSNYSPQQTERAFRALERRGLHLASNQVSYSLLQRWPERSGLMQLCKDLKVTVIAYSPLAQGLLTGKYSPQNPPPGTRGVRTSRATLGALRPLLDEMMKIGIQHGDKTSAQVALNWCVAKGPLAIPGAKNAKQAKENAGALGWRLTDEEVAKLDEMTERGL